MERATGNGWEKNLSVSSPLKTQTQVGRAVTPREIPGSPKSYSTGRALGRKRAVPASLCWHIGTFLPAYCIQK